MVQNLLSRAQFAVDLHFNLGTQLDFGDWLMVDLVQVSNPGDADMTVDLDPSNPASTDTNSDIDTLLELVRGQVGLADNGGAPLSATEIGDLSRTHPLGMPDPPTVPLPIAPDESPTEPIPQVVPLTPALQQIFDESLETPAGRAFYEPNDTRLRNSASSLAPTPGRYTLDLHGSPQASYVGNTALSAAELAALVRADPNWNGEPIHLFSCETGQGTNSFGQQLATELGVDVYAPTELAWGYPDGSSVVSSSYTDSNNQSWPRIPPDGTWRQFQP